MQTTIVPMNLSDIFDRWIKLIGKTAIRNLIIAAIILIPASIIFAYGMNDFFSVIAEMVRSIELNPDLSPDVFMILKDLTAFSITYVIFIIAFLAATIAVTIIGCAEMSHQPLSWSEALGRAFGLRLLRALGQQILLYLALGALFFIPTIFIGLGAGVGSTTIKLLAVVALLSSVAFGIYLLIRWVFALVAIAWEHSGVIQSFGRSAFLVRGFWWRTLGILLLLTIITQFAVSIVVTPVQIFSLWGFFSKYFSMMASLAEGAAKSIDVQELFDSIGMGLGIITFVSYTLLLLIMPLIPVIMYFDLRARKKEFIQSTDFAQAESV